MDRLNRNAALKILFVHTQYLRSAGGEDAALSAESELLRSKGHEVEVLLFDNASMKEGVLGKLGAAISSVYNVHSARLLGTAIKEFNPDIIHVHNFFFTASPSVFYEAFRHKIPVVVTIHNYRLVCTNALLLRQGKVCELCIGHDFPWYGVRFKCYHDSATQSAVVGMMSAIHKWSGTWKKRVDAFITPSDFIRTRLLNSSLQLPPEKSYVKYNFIADPGHSPGPDRGPDYLFVGRLSAEKGVEVLLDAWSELPNDRLDIVGDGPEEEYLQRKYANAANVRFLGKKTKDDVIGLMKRCRALVFPSIWYEGLPLTIIEGFATGTPVIASRLGAMQEMIAEGHNGLLFDAGQSSQLRGRIIEFNDYILNRNFTFYSNARETYLEKYHPDRCFQSVMYIYNKILLIGKTK